MPARSAAVPITGPIALLHDPEGPEPPEMVIAVPALLAGYAVGTVVATPPWLLFGWWGDAKHG